MSGRFPKCTTPDCKRLLFRKTGSQQLTCAGCHQTFQVGDVIVSEPSVTPTPSDDDISWGAHNRHNSGSSLRSEEYFPEKEKNTKLEKSILPPTRFSTYSASASSKSISSDEGGSTISRNLHAVSRRTHRRGFSTASTAESIDETQSLDGKRDDVNYEEERVKPELSETNSLNGFEMDEQPDNARGRTISEDKIEGREEEPTFYEKFYQRSRDMNSSFDSTAFFRKDIPLGYNSKNGQEVKGLKPVSHETNYPLNQSRIDGSSKSDLVDDYGSMQGSIISEEDIEERAYPNGRNSYAYSIEGSTSSRSFSSDEGGSRRGTGGKLFRSQRTYRSHDNNTYDGYDGTHSAARFNRMEKNNVSREQNELNDLVNELAKIGLTREKLLMVLLKQTETNLKEELTHQNRNTRSLVRKLSIQTPATKSPDSASGRSRGGRRRSAAHHCRPLFGGTPFVTCKSCSTLLQLPIGMPNKRFVRIRCGNDDCQEMQVCPLPAKGTTYNPLHKALGFDSARILMAPSRQFSLMDGEQ